MLRSVPLVLTALFFATPLAAQSDGATRLAPYIELVGPTTPLLFTHVDGDLLLHLCPPQIQGHEVRAKRDPSD